MEMIVPVNGALTVAMAEASEELRRMQESVRPPFKNSLAVLEKLARAVLSASADVPLIAVEKTRGARFDMEDVSDEVTGAVNWLRRLGPTVASGHHSPALPEREALAAHLKELVKSISESVTDYARQDLDKLRRYGPTVLMDAAGAVSAALARAQSKADANVALPQQRKP